MYEINRYDFFDYPRKGKFYINYLTVFEGNAYTSIHDYTHMTRDQAKEHFKNAHFKEVDHLRKLKAEREEKKNEGKILSTHD